MSDLFLLDRQVKYLENSIETIKHMKTLDVYLTGDDKKRIPMAPLDDGLVFLLPNGKLAIKIFKHTLKVNENILGDFDEVTLNYEQIDKAFIYDPSSIKNKTYLNLNNEQIIDVMHVGPGDYSIKGSRVSDNVVDVYDIDIELTDHHMSLSSDQKSVETIHLFF